MTDDAQHGGEDAQYGPVDLRRIVPTGYASTQIRSGLIHVDSVGIDDVESGIEIYRDGPQMALKAGTIRDQDRDAQALYTYHALTVEEARLLADSLNEVADDAEEIQQQSESEPMEDSRGLIRRLLG